VSSLSKTIITEWDMQNENIVSWIRFKDDVLKNNFKVSTILSEKHRIYYRELPGFTSIVIGLFEKNKYNLYKEIFSIRVIDHIDLGSFDTKMTDLINELINKIYHKKIIEHLITQL
jgi:hypothetical protein